ncbi:GuaB3 family IMP dehydrogenase-related protein [Natronoglycomyces albus]|uniref:GuaB3 family IMP dehydrogenase-related protein n=2 Tax=Natronoglycomyces albus TaxID=2811108 RepID=A0A895XP03_9ACTN|nr:GuaB3 family IMP dehydrogenase-related protein [Natronoglycomyces albus]QSB07084.1 GuaB3 family IMP dehydrogenase-related protein [Natronoglycomyces albus]
MVEIGPGKIAQRGWRLQDVALAPGRRTRDIDDVSTEWQMDAYRFEIPAVAHPSDATMSPATAIELGRLGGLGVLNGEGLWCRYTDPTPLLKELATLSPETATARLQQMYAEAVKPELISERIAEIRDAGVTVAVRLSPQHTQTYSEAVLNAGVDLLVIQGTIVSAEHVSSTDGALNLKQFIADLDVPVVAGGCTNYKTALHLMRTGAAGVIVGVGADDWSTTDSVLGIDVPMASAVAEAAAARRDYLDETGGRYVHLIADGGITTSGAIAKAIACGADATMLGAALADAEEAPASGAWWHSAASHPKLPRGHYRPAPVETEHVTDMESLLYGPSEVPDGSQNLFGGLRRSMAKCGYTTVKEFQRAGITLLR